MGGTMIGHAHALAELYSLIEDTSVTRRRAGIAVWRRRWIVEQSSLMIIREDEMRADAYGPEYVERIKGAVRRRLATEIAKIVPVDEPKLVGSGRHLRGRLFILSPTPLGDAAQVTDEVVMGDPKSAKALYYSSYIPKDTAQFESMMKIFRAAETVDQLRDACGRCVFDVSIDRQDILVALGRVERERGWQV
jgi:hypothetical protein